MKIKKNIKTAGYILLALILFTGLIMFYLGNRVSSFKDFILLIVLVIVILLAIIRSGLVKESQTNVTPFQNGTYGRD